MAAFLFVMLPAIVTAGVGVLGLLWLAGLVEIEIRWRR